MSVEGSRGDATTLRIAEPPLPLRSTSPGHAIVLTHDPLDTVMAASPRAALAVDRRERAAAPLTSPQPWAPNLSDRLVHATLGVRRRPAGCGHGFPGSHGPDEDIVTSRG